MRNKNIGLWLMAVVFCVSALWFIGCNRGNSASATSEAPPPPAPGVGVVNLDSVLHDLGWADKLKANEDTYQSQLKSEIASAAAHYRTQLETQQKAYAPNAGDKLTQTQHDTLAQMFSAMQQEMSQLQNQANQNFQNYRVEWYKRYRDALTPLARQVAQDRKMTVALVQTDMVLFADPSVDLSNAVVDSARAHQPTITDVTMQPLQAREIQLKSTSQPTTAATRP